MAEALKTYSEFFDQLGQPPGSPDSGASVVSTPNQAPAGASTPSTPNQGTPVPAAGAAPSPAPTAAPEIQPPSQHAPAARSRSALLTPLNATAAQGRSNLATAIQQFQSAAGPTGERTFASAGGPGALETAIGGGAQEPAQSLINARYSGPTSLDPAALERLNSYFAQNQGLTGALQSAGGVQELVRQRTSGLTAGQRALEARNALASPEYRQQAAAAQNEFRNLEATTGSAQTAASDLATQRSAEENAIRQGALDYLTGQGQAVIQGVESRFAPLAAEEQKIADAYARFKSTGTLEDLSALGTTANRPDLAQFNTARRQESVAADQARAAIMAKYPALANVPLLELGKTKKGRETLFLPADYQDQLRKEGKTKSQIKAIQEQARVRQRELESQFGVGTAQRPGNQALGNVNQKPGQFADVAPLLPIPKSAINAYPYAGLPEYTPEDIRPYLGLTIGGEKTVANQATDAERARYNAIQSLLGAPDRLESNVPYVAPELSANLQGYQANEADKAKQQADAVAAARKAWLNVINRGRSRYVARRFGSSVALGAGPKSSFSQQLGNLFTTGSSSRS